MESRCLDVTVTLSQPSLFAGDTLRANVLLTAAKDGVDSINAEEISKLRLDFLTFQFCGEVVDDRLAETKDGGGKNGVTTVVKGSTLFDPKDPYDTKGSASHLGSNGNKKKLICLSDPCVICSDMALTGLFVENVSRSFGMECLLPPFLPPSYVGSKTRFSYFCLLVAQKRGVASHKNTNNPFHIAARQTSARFPVHVLGPRERGLPLLPALGRVVVPQSLRLSDGPRTGSVSKQSGSDYNSTAPPPLTFDYECRAWEGGSVDSQISMTLGVLRSRGVANSYYGGTSTSDRVEDDFALWHATRLIRKHGPGIASLLHASMSNSPQCDDSPSHSTRCLGMPLGRQLSLLQDDSDPASEESVAAALKSYSLSRENHRVCKVRILSVEPSDQSSSPPVLPLGGLVDIHLDFGEAELKTYEVEVSLVRIEKSLAELSTAKRNNKLGKENWTVSRSVVVERHAFVMNILSTHLSIGMPHSIAVSFETDLVCATYALKFRFVGESLTDGQ